MHIHANTVAQAVAERLAIARLFNHGTCGGIGALAGVAHVQRRNARRLRSHYQRINASVLIVRLAKEERAAKVVAVVFVDRAKVKGDGDWRVEGNLQHLVAVVEIEGKIAPHVVEGGDEGVAGGPVAAQLVVHLGYEVKVRHAVLELRQRGSKGGLGHGPRLAQYLDFVGILDAAQRPQQRRCLAEGGLRAQCLQVDEALGPGAILDGNARRSAYVQAFEHGRGCGQAVVTRTEHSHLHVARLDDMKVGHHSGQGEDGRAIDGHPGAGEPLAGVHGVAVVGLFAQQASHVAQVGGTAEEEQVNVLGAHLLLDALQAGCIVGHGFVSFQRRTV